MAAAFNNNKVIETGFFKLYGCTYTGKSCPYNKLVEMGVVHMPKIAANSIPAKYGMKQIRQFDTVIIEYNNGPRFRRYLEQNCANPKFYPL